MAELDNTPRKMQLIWNDRQGDRFVCHILNVFTGKKRTLPYPIYTISPDGRSVVIDSPHEGNGRQMYLIDISAIVGRVYSGGST